MPKPPAPAALAAPSPRWAKVSRAHWAVLACILLQALVLRMVRLDEPPAYYFDEIYYGFTAKEYLAGNRSTYDPWAQPPKGVAYEWTHPPLGKLIMAGTMAVAGEGWRGLRISSVVAGTASVALVFLLAMELFEWPAAALAAAFLYSIEGLSFTHSRMAMLEPHMVLFLLGSLVCYVHWRRRRGASLAWLAGAGFCAGCMVATKWTGLYLLALLGADFAIRWVRARPVRAPKVSGVVCVLALVAAAVGARAFAPPPWATLGPFAFAAAAVIALWRLLRLPLRMGLAGAGCLVVLPAAVYLASYLHYFSMGYGWGDLRELHWQMWYYHTHLTATHKCQSAPWEWLLNLRPVWLYVARPPGGESVNIYDLGNSVVLYFGLAAVAAMAVQWVRGRDVAPAGGGAASPPGAGGPAAPSPKRRRTWPAPFLLAAYLVFWLPWVFSPRIMFFYHYVPAIPMLCVAAGALLARWMGDRRAWVQCVALAVVALAIAWFLFFLPQMTGIPVSQEWAERAYYWLPSWRGS